MQEIKEGTLGDVPSFFQGEHRGVVLGLVCDVCGNDHEFGLAIALGKLDFLLAHREFTAKGIAFRPNLIEEVVVAKALEQ